MNTTLIARAGAADERRHQASAEMERIEADYYTGLAKAHPDEMDDFLNALATAKGPVLAARNKFFSVALNAASYDSVASRNAVAAFKELVHAVSEGFAVDALEAQRIEQEQDASEAAHEQRSDDAMWLDVEMRR